LERPTCRLTMRIAPMAIADRAGIPVIVPLLHFRHT
jgi:hypothetical protein